MQKNFLRISIKSFIICLLLITITFFSFLLTRKSFAGSENFYYFTCSVGETYETAGVNYHSNVDGSYVIYSTKNDLSNYLKAETTSVLWGVEQDQDDDKTGFDNRYVCRSLLTGLLPNTTYYYQAVCDDAKSEIYHFKTGNVEGDTSILFLTDTQSSNKAAFQKINPLVESIEKVERNLNLLIMTGDIVDRGGYSEQWNGFFEGLTSIQNYQQATIPGNHEYYHTKDSSYINALYYNQFYYNPQNGLEDRLNSSYYFIYNDILIFMLDILPNTKNGYDLKAHQEWFKEVVANNPTRWIIVGSHAGAISAGAYASDARQVYNNWHEVWEECQVDLAISGHEHIYIRKDLAYQGDTNEELGVTYLVGPAAGAKDYAASNKDGLTEVLRGNYRGQVIKTQGSQMTVTLYSEGSNGRAEKVTSFTIQAKRNDSVATISDEEILNSVTTSYNESENTLEVSWTSDVWGNVKSVSSTGDFKWEKVVASCSNSFSKQEVYNVLATNNYNFTINFHKKDGTTISKDISLILNKDLIPSSMTINGNKKLNVNDQTTLSVEVLPAGGDNSVTWESLNPEILSVDENGVVTALSAGKGKIKAVSVLNPNLTRTFTITVSATTKPTSLEIVNLPEKFEVGNHYAYTIIASPNDASKDVTWTSSNEAVAQVANGYIYIVGYGDATLTATSTVAPSISCTITLNIYKPLEKIVISNRFMEIQVGKSVNLSTLCTPDKYADTIVWESSDPSIATINNGFLEAHKEGEVTIKVMSAENSSIYDEFTFSVVDPNTTKKGCSCKKDLYLALSLITIVSTFAIILRKKH